MEKKTKVLQVVWRFNTGGAERMVVNIHNYFTNSTDIQIRTLSFTPSKGEIWEKEIVGGDVKYIPLAWYENLPRYLMIVFKNILHKRYRKKWFLSQVKEYQPDIIHIHLANMASELYESCKYLPGNIRIFYHMHTMPEMVPQKYRDNIIKGFSNNVYIPLCVTELQLNSAKRVYGITKASVIYNGINESKFTCTDIPDEKIKNMKKSLEISINDFVIGTVGRGAPVKNFPLLGKIAAELAKTRKTTLLIVGDVPIDLRSNILSNSGDAHVIFAGQRSDTHIIYRLLDVFVLTSFYESSSIVTVEAQLSNIPCVISNSISDEVIISNGVIKQSPYESPKQWAYAIEKVASTKLILHGEQRFDFDNSAKELLKIYKS